MWNNASSVLYIDGLNFFSCKYLSRELHYLSLQLLLGDDTK